MTRNNANGDTIPAYSFAVGISSGVGERWIRLWGGDLPCDVEVRLGRIGAGQFVCTGIRVGANGAEDEYEVTARMLRDIRLGNVLRFIREAYSPSLYGPEVSPAFDIRMTPLEGITLVKRWAEAPRQSEYGVVAGSGPGRPCDRRRKSTCSD
jgi:hypothetical protein